MLKKLINWLEHQSRVMQMERAIRDHDDAVADVLTARSRVRKYRAEMDKLIAEAPTPMPLSDWHTADV